ncbi:MAG: putative lipoprotein [bacterium]|nr:MAG: putative lipoprotein [bacterium]KAF0148003.1 MAG: putative lipoprotein [bacterium]KAF0167541.1 MAG: putative lipoprotein [bacterium]
MRAYRCVLLAALAAGLLSACANLGGRPQPVSHFVLEIPAAATAQPTGDRGGVLLLRDTESPGVFQSVRLVYSRTPGTLAYYQYARWSDAPSRSLNARLRQRLNDTGPFAAVVPLGAGVRAEYQLNTRLREFFHDAVHPPGVARVALEAELVRREDGRLLARELFRAEAPAASYDAAGAAVALGAASGRLLDELAVWLARVRPADAR